MIKVTQLCYGNSMDRFSISIPEDLSEEIADLHEDDDGPYDNRSNAIAQLCELGLSWRLAFEGYDGDPADAREDMEELYQRVEDLEDQLEEAETERRELLHVARGVVEQDRGLLDRLVDAISGRDPYENLPAIEAEPEPDSVDALPVDRE